MAIASLLCPKFLGSKPLSLAWLLLLVMAGVMVQYGLVCLRCDWCLWVFYGCGCGCLWVVCQWLWVFGCGYECLAVGVGVGVLVDFDFDLCGFGCWQWVWTWLLSLIIHTWLCENQSFSSIFQWVSSGGSGGWWLAGCERDFFFFNKGGSYLRLF